MSANEEQRQATEQAMSTGLSEHVRPVASSRWGQPVRGQNISGFRLEELIGAGGMGVVWKAFDLTAERWVVLKFVPPELQCISGEMARVKESFSRVHALQHEHICPLYLLGEDPEYGHFLVMKYIQGKTLSEHYDECITQQGVFSFEQTLHILRQLASALDYAHKQKVIHRDVKPQNIMVVGEPADVQLLDFGLVAEIHTSMSNASRMRMDASGTRPYMAPEQWRGEYQDANTDQYALAVVAYELLTGRLPFANDDFDILRACVLNDPPRPIEGQPEAVNRALMVGLAKQRKERFGNCVELIEAMSGGPRGLHREPCQPVVSVPSALMQPSEARVQVREVSIEPLDVQVERVVSPQVSLPGLPEIPTETLELEGRLEGLEQALAGLRDGTHPSLHPAQAAIGEAEEELKRLEADLEQNTTGISAQRQIRLEQEVTDDPNGRLSRLCDLCPDVSPAALLPYIQRLRTVTATRHNVNAARRTLDNSWQGKTDELEQEASQIRARLVSLQDEDLRAVLTACFLRLGDCVEFPLEAWLTLEPLLAKRRYRWEPRVTLAKAEAFFSEWSEERTWQAAEEGGESEVQAYLSAWPNGRHKEQLTRLMKQRDEAAWQAACAKDTADAYREYLVEMPKGRHVSEAKVAVAGALQLHEDDVAWESAQKKGTVEGYQEYLSAMRYRRHILEASEQVKRLQRREVATAWKAAEEEGTDDAYRRFIVAHPNSRYAREAQNRLDGLSRRLKEEAAQAAWKAAEAEGSDEAYRHFITAHPYSRYAREAQNRLDASRRRKGLKGILSRWFGTKSDHPSRRFN